MCRAGWLGGCLRGLRRWRCVFPLDAGIGQTPHIMAKLASERSRSGLSPTATITAPAFSVPTPSSSSRLGAIAPRPSWTMNRSSSSDLSLMSRILRARAFRESNGRDHRLDKPTECPASRPHSGTQALHAGAGCRTWHAFRMTATRGVVTRVLLQGRAAALDCQSFASFAALRRAFHAAGTVFGHLDPASCASTASAAVDRIQGVVLALRKALRLAGSGPVTSSTPESARCRVMRQLRRPYRWIPLLHEAARMRAEPAKHRPVAGSGGGERFGTKHRSVVAHDGGGVQVLVGVDATDDLDVVAAVVVAMSAPWS